ncbi:Metallo-dependent phosphatase-like protein [Dipodascopsis tothii]|uniref:Metallo-dependent phosphatase-like protein n=1 Tax=Dipodascopsis tothii TaxID=44089 RepID=UPI0034CFFA6D
MAAGNAASAALLMKQYQELVNPRKAMPSFTIELRDDDIYVWSIGVMILNRESAYYGGYFKAEMQFPKDYPFNPPTFRFLKPLYHPNVYLDGRVCISILHAGEDATSGERPEERWNPAQSVESILISIVSLLEDPNPDSPANVDASVAWRNDRDEYNRRIKRQVEASKSDLPPDFVYPESDVYVKPASPRMDDDDEFWYESAGDDEDLDNFDFDDLDGDVNDSASDLDPDAPADSSSKVRGRLTKELEQTSIMPAYSSDDTATVGSTDDESVSSAEERAPPTAEEQQQAAELKDQANKKLAASDYQGAIELYSRAIALDSTKEVYWANRAQAYIKDEAYGAAIADASEAIKLNPAYVKSYYRRATAQMALVRPKEALKDFNAVLARAPSDKTARARRDECQKIVRRLAFEAAIDAGEDKSPSADVEYESMTVDAAYDGVRLESATERTADGRHPRLVMTREFIEDMIVRFKAGKRLPRKYVYAILIEVMKIFRAEPTMVEFAVPADGTVMSVCGDTHGQFYDLLELFRFNGMPSPEHVYLFNGDFVDRGSWSTEIALLLLSFKWLYPTRFFLNRGNHETDDMNQVYGFEGECKAKYSEKIFKIFSECFSTLPLATLIGDSYLVLHGGLFSNDDVSLADIRKLNRFAQKQPGQSGLMMEMLWTDPQPQPGRGPSKRGVGMQFGPDVTKRFCDSNGLRAVIRSHEVRMGGYEVEHDGRLITVFSAPNYCDSQGNKGAVINMTADYELSFETYDAVPHPDVKPMAYASNFMM